MKKPPRRLLTLPATVMASSDRPIPARRDFSVNRTTSKRDSARHLGSECRASSKAKPTKLESWADDLKLGLEREIKEMDRQIKEARRAATAALSLEEKLAAQKQIRALESQRNAKRKSLFEAQDQVDAQRDQLIAEHRGKAGAEDIALPALSHKDGVCYDSQSALTTMASMITELRIENFKSFGSGMTSLALRPLNFIVGANASGKTNLVSALRFLKIAMLQSVEVAANEYGGITEVRNKILRERDRPKPFRIMLRVSAPPGRLRNRQGVVYSISSYHYCVEIDLRAADGVPVVISELLKAELALPNKEIGAFQLKRGRDYFSVLDPMSGPEEQKYAIEEDDATRLVAGSSSFIGPVVGRFRRFIERWSFFNINPEVVRQASKDIVDPDLGESGESLATILHLMEKDGNSSIANLVQGLRGAVPSFKSVRSRPQEAEGKRTFQVIEERLRAGINPRAVSDERSVFSRSWLSSIGRRSVPPFSLSRNQKPGCTRTWPATW